MISTDEPSFAGCNFFRQDVWDKKLLTRAGAKKIRWDALKEADTLSISLWKEWTGPLVFSIVFRALKKGKNEQELIELNCRDALTKRHIAERRSLKFFEKWPNQRRMRNKTTRTYTSISTLFVWQPRSLRRRKSTRS